MKLSEDNQLLVLVMGMMGLGAFLFVLALMLATTGHAATSEPAPALLPVAARPYARSLIRESRAVFGMKAPTAMFAAQIQTESAWHPNAHSAYAAGLAQFIPSTARAMARSYPKTLGSGDVLNPEWSIRALVQYDHDIYVGHYVNAVPVPDDCDRWAFALSGYNGGEGWLPRDRGLCRGHAGCSPALWWGNVEKYTSRSASNAQQNREYPRRILRSVQPAYRSLGGFVSCRS